MLSDVLIPDQPAGLDRLWAAGVVEFCPVGQKGARRRALVCEEAELDKPTCGVSGCAHRARWALTSLVDEPAATYLCSIHWSILKTEQPDFASLYSPVDALPIGFVMPEVAARLAAEDADNPSRLKLEQARNEAAAVLRSAGDGLADVVADTEVKHGESPGALGKGTLALDFSRHVAGRRAGPVALQFDAAWLALVPEATLSQELIRWLRYGVVSTRGKDPNR